MNDRMDDERELLGSGEVLMVTELLVVEDVTVEVDDARLDATRSDDSSAILLVLGMMVERME